MPPLEEIEPFATGGLASCKEPIRQLSQTESLESKEAFIGQRYIPSCWKHHRHWSAWFPKNYSSIGVSARRYHSVDPDPRPGPKRIDMPLHTARFPKRHIAPKGRSLHPERFVDSSGAADTG